MKLVLDRIFKGKDYTIGKLYIDGEYLCDTLEDTDRGIKQSDDLSKIQAVKVYGKTAIPTGTYTIVLDIVSPKFSKYPFYQEICNGKLPRLLNVPGFDGILIHVGDGPKAQDLTFGCILVGYNKIKGQLVDGKKAFKMLYSKMKQDKSNTIIISNGTNS